jgi:hypothetical protein
MNEKTPLCLIGHLSMDRLYVGSKSEGLYPVLHSDDGKQYRLHHKGNMSLNEKTLFHYAGKTIQVIGDIDNFRGHWRMVLEANCLPLVLGAPSMPSNLISEEVSDAGSEVAPEISNGSALGVAADVEREEPATKTKRSGE